MLRCCYYPCSGVIDTENVCCTYDACICETAKAKPPCIAKYEYDERKPQLLFLLITIVLKSNPITLNSGQYEREPDGFGKTIKWVYTQTLTVMPGGGYWCHD